METLVFKRINPTTVVLNQPAWPQTVNIDCDILEEGGPFVEQDDDGYVSFSVANGCAWYRIFGMFGTIGVDKTYVCRLVTGFLGGDP